MRSGGGGGENFEGDRDVDFYRLPSQYQIILLTTEVVAVIVKMMRMVSLMVAMVASMGRPFAFSLANLPVFNLFTFNGRMFRINDWRFSRKD